MNTGVVHTWIVMRRFGWVLDLTKDSPTYGRTLFLHLQNWEDDAAPKPGDVVLFEVAPGRKTHKFQAVKARLAPSQDIKSLPLPAVDSQSIGDALSALKVAV